MYTIFIYQTQSNITISSINKTILTLENASVAYRRNVYPTRESFDYCYNALHLNEICLQSINGSCFFVLPYRLRPTGFVRTHVRFV